MGYKKRGDVIKRVNLDSREQREAAEALRGACCANANTSRGRVTVGFAVSRGVTFAGCTVSRETVSPLFF